MEYLVEWTIAGIIIVLGPILTIFDLPGNTLLMLTAVGYACFDSGMYMDTRLLSGMFFVYVLGECWEATVSLFGIKRKKVSWWAVLVIAIGGFIGTVLGTGIMPVFGSIAGGLAGAFAAAFAYEYLRTGKGNEASSLAWAAAKMRFLALIGKLVAGLALAIMLAKLIYIN